MLHLRPHHRLTLGQIAVKYLPILSTLKKFKIFGTAQVNYHARSGSLDVILWSAEQGEHVQVEIKLW